MARDHTGPMFRTIAGLVTFGVLLGSGHWVAAQGRGRAAGDAKSARSDKATTARNAYGSGSKTPAAPVARGGDSGNSLAASIKSSEIDSLLEKEIARGNNPLSPVTNDEDFLRRVYLDLTGKPPAPNRLDEFTKSTDPAKRSRVIDELLDTDDYARHWARYWRDVIAYHAIERRALSAARNFEDWMADQLKRNVKWDRVAAELITATGPVQEEGRTFLIFAQFDMENTPVNLAAETSRVFLGIQIQCAQCHDHPYDEWKREQFHEMAAFFARTLVRRDPDGSPIAFEVKSLDKELEDRFPGLAKAKAKGKLPPLPAAKKGGGRSPEHRMPDKEDPEKMTVMHPKFLLGQEPGKGLDDASRREQFAQYVTDKSNYWFARAYVNRVWGELMGEGFYEPVDDLGPGREARFPMIVNRLASAWRAADYDVKWLFRLIMNTAAYQREIRPRDPSAGALPFASVCPTRLSGDQIFDSLVHALGLPENVMPPRDAAGPGARRQGAFGFRGLFNLQFGVDPSVPTDDVQGTIPQALFLMNNPLIEQQISGGGDTMLSRWLSVYEDDEELIRLMYKRVLARAPAVSELKTAKDYIREVGNRREAMEDLLWSLVNSTEFITKR